MSEIKDNQERILFPFPREQIYMGEVQQYNNLHKNYQLVRPIIYTLVDTYDAGKRRLAAYDLYWETPLYSYYTEEKLQELNLEINHFSIEKSYTIEDIMNIKERMIGTKDQREELWKNAIAIEEEKYKKFLQEREKFIVFKKENLNNLLQFLGFAEKLTEQDFIAFQKIVIEGRLAYKFPELFGYKRVLPAFPEYMYHWQRGKLFETETNKECVIEDSINYVFEEHLQKKDLKKYFEFFLLKPKEFEPKDIEGPIRKRILLEREED